MAQVLITGGNGLIGQELCKTLLHKGYDVAILSRGPQNTQQEIPSYHWNPEKALIDKDILNSADYIIHLAGANIGDKRWSQKRKNEIIDSRVKSAELLRQSLNKENSKLRAFISASAIGYYGSISSDKTYTETDSSADDFLSNTCKIWEKSADKFNELSPRVVKIRTGIVFSKKGSILSKLSIPIKIGFGSSLGNGKQYLPWIHIDDLCNIYVNAIENAEMKGPYNAVAPEHITNNELTKKIAKTLKRPLWLPNIPSVLIKIIFGEMSVLLLNGSRVSSKKIMTANFKFKYPSIQNTLENLLK